MLFGNRDTVLPKLEEERQMAGRLTQYFYKFLKTPCIFE